MAKPKPLIVHTIQSYYSLRVSLPLSLYISISLSVSLPLSTSHTDRQWPGSELAGDGRIQGGVFPGSPCQEWESGTLVMHPFPIMGYDYMMTLIVILYAFLGVTRCP